MQKKMKIYKPNTKNNNPYLSDPEIERILAKLDLREELGTNFYAIEQHELDGDEVANKHKNKVVNLDQVKAYYKSQKEKTLTMLHAHEVKKSRRESVISQKRKISAEKKELQFLQEASLYKFKHRWDDLVRARLEETEPQSMLNQLEKRWLDHCKNSPAKYREFSKCILATDVIDAASSLANRICRDVCQKAAESKESEPIQQRNAFHDLMDCAHRNKQFNTQCFKNMLIRNTSYTEKGNIVHWNHLETAFRYFFEWRIACFI